MKTYIITEQDIERLYTLFPDLGEGLQACTIINNWVETLEYVSNVKLPYSGIIKEDGNL